MNNLAWFYQYYPYHTDNISGKKPKEN